MRVVIAPNRRLISCATAYFPPMYGKSCRIVMFLHRSAVTKSSGVNETVYVVRSRVITREVIFALR